MERERCENFLFFSSFYSETAPANSRRGRLNNLGERTNGELKCSRWRMNSLVLTHFPTE